MQGAFPLQWPTAQQRTHWQDKKFSAFKSDRNRSIKDLERELNLLGAENIVLSTNLRTRIEGGFYANQGQPDDTGVAVYFDYEGSRHCMAVDQYIMLWENIRALVKSVEAMRGIERWGGAKILQTAMGGFRELPANVIVTDSPWYITLGVEPDASRSEIRQAYTDLSKVKHPDVGGDAEEFARIKRAYDKGILQHAQ